MYYIELPNAKKVMKNRMFYKSFQRIIVFVFILSCLLFIKIKNRTKYKGGIEYNLSNENKKNSTVDRKKLTQIGNEMFDTIKIEVADCAIPIDSTQKVKPTIKKNTYHIN